MTVIVWDGEILATDCAASDGDIQWRSIKAWYHEEEIISGYGVLGGIIKMRDWYKQTRDFPTNAMATLLVVGESGLSVYDGVCVPEVRGFIPCAFGHGRELALGAMAMGAGAATAVEIANQYSVHCGLGVKTYRIGLSDADETNETS